MPSPFPGMNPYLEYPYFWPEIHHFLIVEIARLLSPQLRPKYFVSVEFRVYESSDDSLMVGIPDVTVLRSQNSTNSTTSNVAVATLPTQSVKVTIPIPRTIREGYLEIKNVATKQVVTVIELLSPTNKRTGKGREMYEEKREEILGSRTNLVEIDLLRSEKSMPVIGNNIESHYRILVCRGNRRPNADLYAFNLQNIMPVFPLPLGLDDVEPVIDLHSLLDEIYDVAAYDLKIDYSGEVVPPLLEADSAWVDAWLRERGLRE